jgi:hypothetical protein
LEKWGGAVNYKQFEDLPCWLKAREPKYINEKQFAQIYEFASECRKQIKGFRKYLRDYDPNS